MIITTQGLDFLADRLAETPEGLDVLRSEWEQQRSERRAAERAEREQRHAERLAEWAALPTGARLLDVPPTPLDGIESVAFVVPLAPTYPLTSEQAAETLDRWGLPNRYRTTARPSLGTDDFDAPIIERVEVVSESETVETGSVVCRASVRLWTGSVHYGTADGSASGSLEEFARVRSEARRAAEQAARRYRSEMRSRTAVLGSDAPIRGGSSTRADLACVVSGEDFRTLRTYVSRRAFGNALDGSRSAHVRAGLGALGVPIDAETVSDATGAAVEILNRWASEGLPESLAERAEQMREEGEDIRPLLLGSAARDGLRMITGANRPTALAAARARFAARLAADPRPSIDAPTDARSADARRLIERARPFSGSGSEYVSVGRSERITSVVLSRRADGSLAFPTLAALLLLDTGEERGTGGILAAARLLLGSSSGAARRTIKARAAAEWAAAEGLRLPEQADDSTDALRSGAVAVVR